MIKYHTTPQTRSHLIFETQCSKIDLIINTVNKNLFWSSFISKTYDANRLLAKLSGKG